VKNGVENLKCIEPFLTTWNLGAQNFKNGVNMESVNGILTNFNSTPEFKIG
jgi:hypothetical protein